MTLPKLLIALMGKDVKLYLGVKGRIRFRPRGPVSEPMKAAIKVHGDAIRELLRDGDVESWRMIRLDKPQADVPPEDSGGDYLDDDYEPDVELEYRQWREELERERESVTNSNHEDLVTYQPFIPPSPDDDDGTEDFPTPF